MAIKQNELFVFYDGQIQPIDKKRMSKFDKIAFHDRYYPDQNIITNELINELGAFAIDFTNIHSWSHELPDIDDRSARLFTIWAEDINTKEVIAIVKGHIILHPFAFDPSEDHIEDYYFGKTDAPYYPKVLITTFRIVLTEAKKLDDFIAQLSDVIEIKWQSIRERVISSSVNKKIRKRFILSFKKIIYYSYIIPSVEQDLIKALKRKDYLLTGISQHLSSKSVSYNEALVAHHINDAKKLISQMEKE
ncbi:MAG: hypothetical protein ACW964_00145 [Candidatus Hodarchaeales archaeon]|jgi:hypothetical protein